jgi:hypothetical protein
MWRDRIENGLAKMQEHGERASENRCTLFRIMR